MRTRLIILVRWNLRLFVPQHGRICRPLAVTKCWCHLHRRRRRRSRQRQQRPQRRHHLEYRSPGGLSSRQTIHRADRCRRCRHHHHHHDCRCTFGIRTQFIHELGNPIQMRICQHLRHQRHSLRREVSTHIFLSYRGLRCVRCPQAESVDRVLELARSLSPQVDLSR